jgi:hypothetical protein
MNDDPNRSVWVHDWTDAAHRERYTFHAREIYESNKRLRMAAQAGHVDYGKWLIASMLAIHSGSIYAISNLRDHIGAKGAGDLVSAATLNVAGIAFIMVAGFLAWLNFQFAEKVYAKWSNPAILYRTGRANEELRFDPITPTLYGAAAGGILSWLFFIGSAVDVVQALRAVAG